MDVGDPAGWVVREQSGCYDGQRGPGGEQDALALLSYTTGDIWELGRRP